MKFLAHLLFILVATLPRGSVSFPNGAGGCAGGEAAVDDFHLQGGMGKTIETGSLENNGFEVSIDGNVLDPNEPYIFTIGVDHVLLVEGRDRFLGILVRLEAEDDGVDTIGALDENSNNLQEADACIRAVVGITHTNNNRKRDAEIILRLDETTAATLDITLVLANNVDESIYYYSGYNLEAIEQPSNSPSISSAPSNALSASPSSSPSLSPSESPSFRPSGSPVAPSSNPSASPSLSFLPSWLPSIIPSAIPSGITSAVPSVGTKAPSKSPSFAPSEGTKVPTRSPSFTPTDIPTFAPTFLACNICGGDLFIANPDGLVTNPFGMNQPTCAELEEDALSGIINPQFCLILPGLTRDPCLCGDAPTTSPSPGPTVSPTLVPTYAPTFAGQTGTPTQAPSTAFPSTIPSSSPTQAATMGDTSGDSVNPEDSLAPTPGPSPVPIGDFPFCNICGTGLEVGNPDGTIFNPIDMSTPSCIDVLSSSELGKISPEFCRLLPAVVTVSCECQLIAGTTAAPVNAPTLAPTISRAPAVFVTESPTSVADREPGPGNVSAASMVRLSTIIALVIGGLVTLR